MCASRPHPVVAQFWHCRWLETSRSPRGRSCRSAHTHAGADAAADISALAPASASAGEAPATRAKFVLLRKGPSCRCQTRRCRPTRILQQC